MNEQVKKTATTEEHRQEQAKQVFRKAVQLHQANQLDQAIKLYSQACVLNPSFVDAHNNLGVALRASGRARASVACYLRAINLSPDHGGAYSNLGNAYRDLDRYHDAADCHRKAVELSPNSPQAVYNLGLILRDLGLFDDALYCFDKVLQLQPDNNDCKWDRALNFLTDGQLRQGFDLYDARWGLERSPPRPYKQPKWDGQRHSDKILFIHHEQGFGDMIQFVRYFPMIKERFGGKVIFECQAELKRLFSQVKGIDGLFRRGQAIPVFDYWLPLMSVASLFETDEATLPGPVPYLQAPRPRQLRLNAPVGSKMKVGIVWGGSPTHQNNKRRSVALEEFLKLLEVPDVAFFSLQKGPGVADIEKVACQGLIANLDPVISDFQDSAALIEQLDLVIGVDTAIIHLCGAMNKPVWALLPYSPDWRWMWNREDSPWYPSLRLFRQMEPSNWREVFDRVHNALSEEVKKY